MAVSGEATDGTKWKVSIIRLELKDALKRLSTQIEIESQAAILRIRAEPERSGSEALQKTATCRSMLHNRVAEVRCDLSHTTDWVTCFDVNIAVIEPGQTVKAGSNQ